jgi:hypothetical protein
MVKFLINIIIIAIIIIVIIIAIKLIEKAIIVAELGDTATNFTYLRASNRRK